MTAKVVLLSGITAFGIGLAVAGALFHEPGGGERRQSRSPPAATAPALAGEGWRLSVPASSASLHSATATAPSPEVATVVPNDDPDAVWATPARWSETD